MFKKFISMVAATLMVAMGLSALTASTANAFSIADNSTVSLISTDSNMRNCPPSSNSFATIGAATRVRSFAIGDNFDFSSVTTASFVWNSALQTEYNTILNRAGTTRTTFSPTMGTTYTFYRLKEGSTNASYFCRAGQVDLLINGTNAVTGWIVSNFTFFTAGGSSAPSVNTTQGAAILGPDAVAEQRQRQAAINTARTSLTAQYVAGKAASLSALSAAALTVSSAAALERLNTKVLALPIDKRSSIQEIQNAVDLENFVDRISNSETRPSVSTHQLVSRGFIAADNRLKVSLTNALLNRDSSSLNSVEKIKAAIVEETTRLQERAKRTAEIKAKIAARKK